MKKSLAGLIATYFETKLMLQLQLYEVWTRGVPGYTTCVYLVLEASTFAAQEERKNGS